ncbi:MAG TPA: pseudouridylate synthase [Marinilabiliales bacterium]|nr:pseudouridylate synthase [Marinilabiliales bacterium]
MQLEIIYHQNQLVAINKPHGLLVHRSKYADEAKEFAVQELRNQIGCYVYPVHRLDRKTAGVLVFALNTEMNAAMNLLFAENRVSKKYLAVVRGHTDDSGIIDYPLVNDAGKNQEAVTYYRTLQRSEISVPFGKFQTSRYSLVEVEPHTGRIHQIRKHFAHIFHPIIGDRPHGCNKQNRLFKERWGFDTMLLHATEVTFLHPETNIPVLLQAGLHPEFRKGLELTQLSIRT